MNRRGPKGRRGRKGDGEREGREASAKIAKKHRVMLLAAESSLRKDWESSEEDVAWADL